MHHNQPFILSETIHYIPNSGSSFYTPMDHPTELRTVSPTRRVQEIVPSPISVHHIDNGRQTSYDTFGAYTTKYESSPLTPSKTLSYGATYNTVTSPQSFMVIDNNATSYALKPTYTNKPVYTYNGHTDPLVIQEISSSPSKIAEEKPKEKPLGFALSPSSRYSSIDQYTAEPSNFSKTNDIGPLRMGYTGEVLVSSVLEKVRFDGRRASEFEINSTPVTGPILLSDKKNNASAVSTFAVSATSQIKPAESPKKENSDVMAELDKKVLSILGKSSISITQSPSKTEKRPSIFGIANLDFELNNIQSSYQGQKKDGKPHGLGKMTFVDGKKLEGEFFEGQADGQGKLYNETSGVCYEGKFKQDKFDGEGRLYNENPKNLETPFNYKDFCDLGRHWVLYVGDFKDGKKNGVGTLYLSNGEKYYGEFNEDKIEGKGCYYFKGEVYGLAGEWKKNKLIEQF